MNLRERAEVICFKWPRVLCDLRPYVCFPGGGIDPGESPIDAAKREAMEEAGRQVIACTVAHPPTVQKWAKAYREKWQQGFDGGHTYWLTGSTSDEPVNTKHDDYQPGFKWHLVEDVIRHLKTEMHGDWSHDVKVRLSILEHQVASHRPVDADQGPAKLSVARPRCLSVHCADQAPD